MLSRCSQSYWEAATGDPGTCSWTEVLLHQVTLPELFDLLCIREEDALAVSKKADFFQPIRPESETFVTADGGICGGCLRLQKGELALNQLKGLVSGGFKRNQSHLSHLRALK